MGQLKIDNPYKLSTWAHTTQDDNNKKPKNYTICVGPHYAKSYTNNVINTRVLLQIAGSIDEPNIVFMGKS